MENKKSFYLAMDYLLVIVELMADGIYVNPSKLDELDLECQKKIADLRQEIEQIVGVPVTFADDDEETEE